MKTATTMWTPALGGYAYGWEIEPPSPKTFGHARMSHSGGINGFGANLVRVPDAKLTAIVLSNNESAPATVMSNVSAKSPRLRSTLRNATVVPGTTVGRRSSHIAATSARTSEPAIIPIERIPPKNVFMV